MITAIVVAVMVLGAGAAFAYWTATGAGSGTAKASTAQPLTTVAATAPTNLLYPGGTADVKITVRNSNPFPVSVTGISANGAATASGGIGTCTTTGVTFVSPTGGLPFTVPAKAAGVDGSITVTLTNAATMSSASETGCQSATFTIPVTLSGSST